MSKKTKILDVYFQTNSNYEVRTEQMDGKDYLVVPVTMMVEGVHSGSHGPILHLAEELGRYPESWDGIPVTIGHPRVGSQYVSANSPAVLADWAVGRIFNTRMDGDALRAEAWCCVEDLERVSEDTLEMINNGEIIEVSVGVFSDEEDTTGTWNTENYNAIARNHRPNHLALLPDEVGACSIEDGCGIRVNKKGESKVAKDVLIVNDENREKVLKELNLKGFSVNELGHSQIREKIAQIVYSYDGNGLDNYVEEIYDDYFVYRQFNTRVQPRTANLYKQSYEVDDTNNVTVNGDAVHVRKEVSYEAIPEVNTTGRVKTKRIIQKNKKVMAECTDCVKKLADSLIANKDLAWSEDDRETLQAMSEETLEKMTPPAKEEPQANTAKVSRKDVLEALSSEKLTKEEFMSIAPEEVTSQITEGDALRANKRTEMITEITANSEVYTEDELNAKEFDDLVKVHKMATKSNAVSIGGGGLGGKTQVNTGGNKSKKGTMIPACAKESK